MIPRRILSRDAFSLVEVTLALGIAAFCLIVLVALVPTGINTNQGSIQQSGAASLAQAVVADLRGTALPPATGQQPTVIVSPYYGISVPVVATGAPANTSNSYTHTFFVMDDGTEATTGMDADASASSPPRYRATVTLNAPTAGSAATMAYVFITWPAMADRSAASTPKNFSGSLGVLTEINRN